MSILGRAWPLSAEFERKEWIATDLMPDPTARFMTGVLGFVTDERIRGIDGDEAERISWKEAEVRDVVGATRNTIAPFAIDLRDHERWVAFAPTQRITPRRFAQGLTRVLDAAAEAQGLFPSDWSVDLLPSRMKLEDYLRTHDSIYLITAMIRLPNPGIDLEGDAEAMRRWHAQRQERRFYPPKNENLTPQRAPELLHDLLTGLVDGDVHLRMRDRSGDNYSSEGQFDEGSVDEWGEDLELATQLMLEVIQRYAEQRQSEWNKRKQGRLA